jgi:hypothetical protein
LAKMLDLDWMASGNTALTHASLNGNTVSALEATDLRHQPWRHTQSFVRSDRLHRTGLHSDPGDVHLPLGKLRSRVRGSDGGHTGVRSALVAFQTDEFQRLKIGAAPDEEQNAMPEYLVRPFSSEAATIMEFAIKAATDRILSELSRGRVQRPPGTS